MMLVLVKTSLGPYCISPALVIILGRSSRPLALENSFQQVSPSHQEYRRISGCACSIFDLGQFRIQMPQTCPWPFEEGLGSFLCRYLATVNRWLEELVPSSADLLHHQWLRGQSSYLYFHEASQRWPWVLLT